LTSPFVIANPAASIITDEKTYKKRYSFRLSFSKTGKATGYIKQISGNIPNTIQAIM
jgi:hypothetical protein